MRRTTSLTARVAAVLTVALVLAACAGDSGESTTTAAPAPTEAPETTAVGGTESPDTTAATETTASDTSAATTAPAAQSPETTDLTIGIASPSVPFIGSIVAVEQGFYEAHGLDVEVVPFAGGPATLQALLAGEIQFAETDFTPILNTYENPGGIVAFMSTSAFPSYSFVGTEGIESWDDLAESGGVVGVSAIGGMDHILVRYVLEEQGFDPDVVSYQAAGGPADRARAVLNGQVQLVAATPPGVYELDREGLIRLGDLTDILDGFPLEQYSATTEFYEGNPGTVAALTAAYRESAAWMAENPEETLDILMDWSEALPETREDWGQALEAYLPYFAPESPPAVGYRFLTDYYVDEGLISDATVDEILGELLAFELD